MNQQEFEALYWQTRDERVPTEFFKAVSELFRQQGALIQRVKDQLQDASLLEENPELAYEWDWKLVQNRCMEVLKPE